MVGHVWKRKRRDRAEVHGRWPEREGVEGLPQAGGEIDQEVTRTRKCTKYEERRRGIQSVPSTVNNIYILFKVGISYEWVA